MAADRPPAATPPRRAWLLKTEPTSFSLADLARAPGATTCWDGVRNYQARNLLRDEVAVGDAAFIYHSRVAPMAAVGLARVVRAAYPDPSQFDPGDPHVDPGSPPDAPRWVAIDVQLVRAFAQPVTLAAMRTMPALADMALLRRGSRLSVQPVTTAQWRAICRAGDAVGAGA